MTPVRIRNDKQLTVGELFELLKQFDKDILVYAEGCDCSGKAMGVELADGTLEIIR